MTNLNNMNGFEKLTEAMDIFSKYSDEKYPFDALFDKFIVNVKPEKVANHDKEKLEQLGFFVDEEYQRFYFFT